MFFLNISLHWIITNFFYKELRSIVVLTYHQLKKKNIFTNFWVFGIFFTSSNLVFGFKSSKSHSLMSLFYSNKEHYSIIRANGCGINLEMIKKKMYFSWLVTKIHQTISRHVLSVFRDTPLTPLNTLSLFSAIFLSHS